MIRMKLRPFSHRIGAICMIPWTSIQVQAFPTLLCFLDLATGEKWEETLPWKGPMEGFTVEMDLEKGRVAIFGKTAAGFRRHFIEKGDRRPLEKLSLGKHTKLDWDLVLRRMNIEEIAPVLFSLGQQVLSAGAVSPTLQLLEFSDKRHIVSQLKNFIRVGFSGILAPRLTDDEFQGIVPEGLISGSPLALLSEGYRAIRSLFFQEDLDTLSFLPLLPPEFHAGSLHSLRTLQGDDISFEWSKKLLKRVIIKPAHTRSIKISLQKIITSFRIDSKTRQQADVPLALEAGKRVLLDRFEK